jgi:hypothetical protein
VYLIAQKCFPIGISSRQENVTYRQSACHKVIDHDDDDKLSAVAQALYQAAQLTRPVCEELKMEEHATFWKASNCSWQRLYSVVLSSSRMEGQV